jgi:tetratricopeptide (TPR) repeat protein
MKHLTVITAFLLLVSCGKQAIVRVEPVELTTYPYGDPDPVPHPESAFYPYFKFDGYAREGLPQRWETVTLENDYIRLTVIPAIGGKVWGAVEKSTGREFIYFNHAVKFRNIAMRGPWTSGGIEMNFGIIGHAPTTASPVDYVTRRNSDGSVSCFVAAFDLITRSWWQVEISLPADKAFFTTSVTWSNTSPFPRPYYHWMNAAYRAADDLAFVFPGQYYLGHEGDVHAWPVDEQGRDLSRYAAHDFGGAKSMHVMGNFNDFYGACYVDDRFGSVHYTPFDEKLGMKIFLWGRSRSGMIWEDLLTDNDGQYVELQSGRLYSQAVTESGRTPFKQYAFEPYATDTWTEYWYPVKDAGGMVKANAMGALNVVRTGDSVTVCFSPVQRIDDEVAVRSGSRVLLRERLSADVLQTWRKTVAAGDGPLSVTLGGDRMVYSEDVEENRLSRPVVAPDGFDRNSAYGLYVQGQQAMNENRLADAVTLLKQSLVREPYFIPALRDLGLVHCRRGRYAEADSCARRILSVDAYDADGNFLYGLVSSRQGRTADAVDGFRTAALSPGHRMAACIALAKIAAGQHRWSQALLFAERSLAAGDNVEAGQLLALSLRKAGRTGEALDAVDRMEHRLPLNHYARFERYMLTESGTERERFLRLIRSELPHETFMEMAGWYESMGCINEALVLYAMAPDYPIALYRCAFLLYHRGDDESLSLLERAESLPVRAVFPFRAGTLPALEWAAGQSDRWVNRYYLALLHAALGDEVRAAELLEQCGDMPDDAVFYMARANFRRGEERLKDLLRAERLERSWRTGLALVRYYQEMQLYGVMYAKAKEYVALYPDNDMLGLKYAASMLRTERYRECTAFLSGLTVLPNEGAYEGRVVYREAWLYCALQNVEAGRYGDALSDIERSKEWPEQLGVGKPYDEDIDLRTEDFLTAYCQARLNGTKPPRLDASSDADDLTRTVIRMCGGN